MCTTAVVLLAILAQHSSPTSDAQAKAQAQGLLTEGSGLYERGDYAGALEKFNAAYAAFPSPKLMFNIGQANRDLGRPVEALQAYEKFLAGALDASPETTADARKSLAELRGKLGRIRIDCKAVDAEVSVDGKSVGLAPLPEPIWATPGRHQVTANHQRAALAIENVQVTAGTVQTVMLELHPPAAPVVQAKPPVVAIPLAAAPIPSTDSVANLTSSAAVPGATSSDQPIFNRWWFWTGIGGVVAAGSVTAFLLARRSSNPCSGIGYACLEIK
jgi:hypothetical protein